MEVGRVNLVSSNTRVQSNTASPLDLECLKIRRLKIDVWGLSNTWMSVIRCPEIYILRAFLSEENKQTRKQILKQKDEGPVSFSPSQTSTAQNNTNLLSYSSVGRKFKIVILGLTSRCLQGCVLPGGFKVKSVSLPFPAPKGCCIPQLLISFPHLQNQPQGSSSFHAAIRLVSCGWHWLPALKEACE